MAIKRIIRGLLFAAAVPGFFAMPGRASESEAAAGAASDPKTNLGAAHSESVHRWHLPRKGARDTPRDAAQPDDPDWNPLASPLWDLKDAFMKAGITYDVDLAFFGQSADNVLSGKNSLTTFSWRIMGDWELLDAGKLGTGYVFWNVFGGRGLNYNPAEQGITSNVGSIWALDGTVFRNPRGSDNVSVVDELYWKHVSPDNKIDLLAGKIDLSYHFDYVPPAGDSFTEFFASSFGNNASIPWPTYGGFGGLVRAELSDHLYVMAGIGDSSSNAAVAPWETPDNHSWYQLLQLGLTLDIAPLGKGEYRFTPWHNHLFGEDGWGFGFNFNQELGCEALVGFFRYGIGDENVTPIKQFLSGGVAFNAPFGRTQDTVALGVSLLEPSPGTGVRNETQLETYYRVFLTPTIAVTPNLQIVFDPGLAPQRETAVIGGLRLSLAF